MNKSKLFILLTLFALSCLLMLLSPSARAWQVSISDCQGCGSRAEAAVVDPAGDIIATGSFFYGSDVVKLSGATGQMIWRSEVMGHESRNYVQDIAVDSKGDVFVVFAWTRVLIKVSGTTGAKIWEKPIEGTLNACQSFINAVVVDGHDDVVTAGTIGCLLNVAKFDGQTGDEKWHYEREGFAKAVAVDPFGNVAAAGLMNRNFAVLKLRGENGDELWQREINGAGNFSDVFEEANAVAMDKDGSVVVAGVTSNEVANFRDFTVAKYTPTGDRQWLHAIDGGWCEINDRGERVCQANDIANAVTIDREGNVIAAGSLQADGNPFIRGAVEHFRVIKFSKEGVIQWSEAAQDPPFNEEYTPGHAFAVSVDAFGDVAAGGVHGGRFTVVKFKGSAGERAWPPHQVNSGGLGNGNNAISVVVDAAHDIVAAGEIIGSDGWSKFTVVKLHGTDGTDYFADPTPTPPVPETVLKYAPLVYLHPDDQYRPGNPMTFIQHSKLAWSHQSTVVLCGGGDHDVAARGAVDAGRLGAASTAPYAHSPSNHTNLLCPDRDDISLKAYDYTRPFDGAKRDNILGELNGYTKEGFYLDNDDAFIYRFGTISGPLVFPGAPVFYEYAQGRYVSYWFFYPYNLFQNSVSEIPLQVHEGDWEQISIQLDPNDVPVNVHYATHHKGNLVPWSLVDKYQDTHPIVFSAKGSHASYPEAGIYPVDGPDLLSGFDRADYGPKWFTWNNLLQVEAQPWYGYGGAWGEVGEVPSGLGIKIDGGEFTGPLGPSRYKNSRSKWFLTVGGRVTEIDDRGISGTKLTLADTQGNVVAIAHTDVKGNYSFTELRFGHSYAVIPSKEGYNFTPITRTLPDLRENQTADFKALDTTPPLLTLPSDITENAYIPQGATVYYTLTATDDITKNPHVSCSNPSGSLFPIGVTVVTCTAADDASNKSSGTFKVTIKGAAEQLTDLIVLVEKLGLGAKTQHKFNHELEQAQNALLRRDSGKACREIEQFIKKVNQESRRKITMNQAKALIDLANRIRAVVGCR